MLERFGKSATEPWRCLVDSLRPTVRSLHLLGVLYGVLQHILKPQFEGSLIRLVRRSYTCDNFKLVLKSYQLQGGGLHQRDFQ